MKVHDFSKIFFAILVLHLVVIYKPESEILYMLSRPLLLFSLLAFFIHKTSEFSLGGKSWISAALLTFMVGDILLLSGRESLFLAGMGAFSLAHLFYISFYLNQKLKTGYVLLGFGILVGVASIYGVHQYTGVPAGREFYVITLTAISSLHLLASLRMVSSDGQNGILPVAGAAILILSGALLILFKFNGENKFIHIMAMLTYGVGQFIITTGLVRYIETHGKLTERPSE